MEIFQRIPVLTKHDRDGLLCRNALCNMDKKYMIYCRACGTGVRFTEEEIDRSKAIPHLKCPICKRQIQLHEYYLRKEG